MKSLDLEELIRRAKWLKRSRTFFRRWRVHALTCSILRICGVDDLPQIFEALEIEVTEDQMRRIEGDADVEIMYMDEILLSRGIISDPDFEPAMMQIARDVAEADKFLYEKETTTTKLSYDLAPVPDRFFQQNSGVSFIPLDVPPGTKVKITIQKIED